MNLRPAQRSRRRLVTAAASALLMLPLWSAQAAPPKRDELCFGERATHTGSAGETVVGTPEADVIIGGGRVLAYAGNDLICDASYVLGGDGDDRIQLPNGGTANGEAGNDELIALGDPGGTPATMLGGDGDDVIYGATMGEIVYGGAGNDVIRSGGGRDRVYAGEGNNQVFGGPGRDRIFGGPGNDHLDGGPGRDRGYAGPGNDTCRSIEKRGSCRRQR